MGLPIMYIVIDRKPEDRCKIQNSACGQSGIMMHLKLVMTAADEADQNKSVHGEDDVLHGAAVLKELVQPWAQSGHIVCANHTLLPLVIHCCS